MGLLCPEQNVENLKKWTFKNYGTPQYQDVNTWAVAINSWSISRGNWSHKNMIWVTKQVSVAPFWLKLSPNGSYGRAAYFETAPGAQKANT